MDQYQHHHSLSGTFTASASSCRSSPTQQQSIWASSFYSIRPSSFVRWLSKWCYWIIFVRSIKVIIILNFEWWLLASRDDWETCFVFKCCQMVYFYFLIMKSFYLLECACVAIDIANHKIVITSANSILNHLFIYLYQANIIVD